MKIKSFECPKSIRNYQKQILGTSDTWWTSRLSHRPSELVCDIVGFQMEFFFKFMNFENVKNNPVVETWHFESLIKISKLDMYFSKW